MPVILAQDLGHDISTGGHRLHLIRKLNLEIGAGETVAILGNSGCGKTTLLGLLAGLDRAASGRITLLGKDLQTMSEDQRAALRAGQVGFVYQSFQLLPELTALENVMLPLELTGEPDAREKARSALAAVGLEARQQHRPRQLSGGEQQRVAIARAFAPRPRILFADEPTGNLDDETGTRIADLLFSLNAEYQTTMLLVTHDAELARRCDRRLRLQRGELIDL